MANCSLLEYLPVSGITRNTTVDSVRRTLEELVEVSADQEQAKREKEVIPFTKIPESTGNFRFSEVQYPFQMASILRGPDMFIREDHTSPVIEMGLFFQGGKFAEKSEDAGITRLVTQLMIVGTKEMPARDFHRQLEVYGGRVQVVVDDDYFGILFSILSGNFQAGFNLLQQSIKTPAFDKDDVTRQVEFQKTLSLVRKNSKAFGRDLMNLTLFQDFAYSRNSLGTDASLSGITEDAVRKWHSEYVNNRKPFVVIIGDTKGTSLAKEFVQHFSGSRMRDAVKPEEWTKPLEKSVTVEQDWKKNQSLILIGFQAPPVDDEDVYAASVLANLIGYSDRLPEETREKVAAAQNISIKYKARLRGGSLIACATVEPDNEEDVSDALKQEMLWVVTGPNTYRDIRSAINAAVGVYEIQNQARGEQIRRITENLLAGKGIDGYLNFPTEVRRVDEEELSDAARRILNMEKAVIVRVHGQSRQ
jgi:zinc protease